MHFCGGIETTTMKTAKVSAIVMIRTRTWSQLLYVE